MFANFKQNFASGPADEALLTAHSADYGTSSDNFSLDCTTSCYAVDADTIATVFALEPAVGRTSTGYTGSITVKFKIVDEQAFKDLSADKGTLVTAELVTLSDGGNDAYCYPAGLDVTDPASFAKIFDCSAKFVTSSAKVTYSAVTVSYDGNGAENPELVPSKENVGFGKSYSVKDGATYNDDGSLKAILEKTVNGVHYIFSNWQASGGDTGSYSATGYNGMATKFNMPDASVILTAQYVEDKDDDKKPDTDEYAVTYTLRAGDETKLVFPATTAEGSFYETSNTSGKINVVKDGTIGNAYPTLTSPDKWVFLGYSFDGGKTFTTDTAKVSSTKVTGNMEVIVAAYPDDNNNKHDDRLPVQLTLTLPDGTTVKYDKPVEDGAPYTLYTDPAGTTVGKTGTADTDPTKDTLPDVPKYVDGKLFEGWEFTETDPDGDGYPDTIVATPKYSDGIPVKIPDVVDPDVPDEPAKPWEGTLPLNSKVIYRDVNGDPIAEFTQTVDGTTNVMNDVQNIKAPTPSNSNPNLPATDKDGNAFKGWNKTGPDKFGTGANTEYITYMDPVYNEPVTLTAKNPDGSVIDTATVPKDTPYEIQDQTGKPIKDGTGIIDKDMDVTVPGGLPEKNDNGDYFDGWKVTPVDANKDGIPEKVIVAPSYVEPDPSEIEIIPDPSNKDEATGNGVTVLGGAWDKDDTATITFYMRVRGEAADEKDCKKITASTALSYGFEQYEGKAIYGNFLNNGKATYTGTDMINGTEYGKFTISYQTVKSSIVNVVATYGTADKAPSATNIVITVADANKDNRLTSADYLSILRAMNGTIEMPGKTSTNSFFFELFDCNEDSRLTSSDYLTVLRMMNGTIKGN